MKLMIVESPGKTKKIQSFLGEGWKVMASVGHVRDLPEKEFGVSAPDFRPQYVKTDRGKDVLARLKTAADTAEEVYLATDPDREGEAIAWHLQDALKLSSAKRVTFGEITEKAVKSAIDKARSVDMDLVHAQEGRRVLDRFCGYLVSGPLSRVAGTKLSAGRVQSPALRLVVERERSIKGFKVTTHYGAELVFEAIDNIAEGWKASWVTKPWLEEGQDYILDKSLAEKAAAIRTLTIADVKESDSRSAPPSPFTTSTLQQAASNTLKFNPKRTMELAQRLYEAGHITYMRTDSPSFSEDFTAEAREYCRQQDWPLIEKPRHWKSKDGAQEAHEAIRPTHIEIEEAGENTDEKALYRLIRLRSLACMLSDAIFSVREAFLETEIDGKKTEFVAKGRVLTAAGWKMVMENDQTEDPDDEKEAENPLPLLKAGAQATAVSGKVKTQQTKPPSRFTEAKLVAELEKRGIGRPSTYAAILENITKRGYLGQQKRHLVPTELGEKVVDSLCGNFSFIDYDFTKQMEDTLDAIACGKAAYREIVAGMDEQLRKEVTAFTSTHSIPCAECGEALSRRAGTSQKTGQPYNFFSCPGCNSTFPNEGGKPGAKQESKNSPAPSDFQCIHCGKPLFHRVGTSKKDGKPYDFYACSGYPKCKSNYRTKEDGTPDLEPKN